MSALRTEVIGDCTLYLGDCREVLPTIGRAAAVVTDPPYGLAEKLQGGTWGKAFEGKYKDWDAEAPDLDDVLAHADQHIIWGGNYFALPPSRCWLLWVKPERGLTMADAELAWTSFDANARVFESARNPDGARFHPTQKPIALMAWCVAKTTGVVMDPFMGSGTTGVACINLGRPFVGIERDPKYFDAACRRIAEAYAQPRLFAEPEPKPVQTNLFTGDAA